MGQLFTEVWKEAVQIIGKQYFGPCDVDSAASYRELRPDYDAIKKVLGKVSGGEFQFILAVYSFFNAEAAAELAEGVGFSSSVFGLTYKHDEKRRHIISRLVANTPGLW